ncbi:MAG: DUF2726 domain-containing protein [Anaerolineae bacterium]
MHRPGRKGKSKDRRRALAYNNRIDRKHVDFLLCDPQTMAPLLGIELDDSSHRRPDRRARDELVDRIFESAGLPLLRVPARFDGYNAATLREKIDEILTDVPASSASVDRPESASGVLRVYGPEDALVPSASTAPLCPKCGDEMVLRKGSRGARRGERFWGCPNYPRCHGAREYIVTTDTGTPAAATTE